MKLPHRDQPEDASIDRLCADLVDRVRPGGFAPRVAEPPLLVDGRYRLLHRLGAGGMGEVWCAEHVGIGRRVAIKFLQSTLAGDPRIRRRFVREGRFAARVRHPSVVEIFDVGEAEDGRVYLAMELIAGRTIAEVIGREGPFTWARARAVLEELAGALARAHELGVIHRDIKPSNVMLVGVGDDGSDRCKLIDFGMARGELGPSVDLTVSGAVMGSPAYMSPEQFRGEKADARSDIYSFGCLTHFMLTGQPPFDGATPAAQMYQHLMVPFPGLHDGAVDRWLSKACSKDRAHRYADMPALLEAMPLADGRAPLRHRVRPNPRVAALAVLGLFVAPTEAPSQPEPRTVEAEAEAEPGGPLAMQVASSDPVEETIASVHAGLNFSCALTSAGRVLCWGAQGPHLCQPGHIGHLGDDELPHAVQPLDFGTRRAIDLALGFMSEHVCALLDDGSVRCWGSDASEQLGNGEGTTHWCDHPDESLANLAPLELPPVVDVDAHQYTNCALERGTGALWCWGTNSHGQLGLGHVDALGRPHSAPIDLGGARVEQVSVGVGNVCALLEQGAVRCWGGNRNLQLGADWPTDRRVGDGIGDGVLGALPNSSALDVRGLEGFEVALIRANGGWNCVVSTDGRVRCWGGNDDGAMGYRHDQIPDCNPKRNGYDCLLPTPSQNLDLGDLGGARVIDLQMGRKHACALDDRGALRCWGWGVDGSLGYGSRLIEATGGSNIGHRLAPAQAYAAMGNAGIVDVGDFDRDGSIDPVEQLAMGYSHTCVLVEDGTVRCWGRNGEGELGYGTTDDVGDDETPAQYYAAHGCGAVPLLEGRGCAPEG